MSATLEQAELAKRKLRELLAGVSGINGVGIAVLESGYGVKVNLRRENARAAIPDEIDGVRVIAEVIGIVTAD